MIINRKKWISLIKDNKKKLTLLTALIVCVGVYSISGNMSSKEVDNDDIPLHDGDVLVTSDDVSDAEDPDTYMNELRATLDMDRNKIISMLSDSESSASTPAEKEEASKEKMKLLGYMEQEKTIETLIKNKGLPDSFVVITDNGINVTVNTDELDQSTVTKICEIVMRQTGRSASEIVVQDVT